MFTVRNGMLALAFAFVVFAPIGNAHAATTEEMLTTIQNLLKQIQSLQEQLNTIRGEVKDVLKNGLSEGMTDADIAKLQEILATDPTIYPEGRKTGYFGPLTREAVKRFQGRHGLEITGVVDGETHDLLEEYLQEKFGDEIPPGLLRAPGIAEKVEMRFELKCDKRGHGGGMGPLCTKLKLKHGGDHHDGAEDEGDDNSNDEEEDSNDDSTDYNVEVEIEDGTTTVSFDYGGDNYEVEVDSTDKDDVIDAIADELDTSVDDLESDFVKEVEKKLKKKNNDVDDAEAENDADDAIDDAKNAIDDAENAIDDASGDTTEADDLLDEAKDKLDEAESAFDDEEYADAEDLANEAEDLAGEAEDAL